MRQQILASLAVSMLACAVCSAQNESFFKSISDLTGGLANSAIGLSADGSVVIGYGYRWTEATGKVPIAPPPGWTGIKARSVSADGSVIVGTTGSEFLGFRWVLDDPFTGEGIAVSYPPTLGYTFNRVRAVSDDGSVVVGYMADNGAITPPERAYRWTEAGGYQYIPNLPGKLWNGAGGVSGDGTTVVGGASDHNSSEAFRWSATTRPQGLGDLPGGAFQSGAGAASQDGSVIVGGGRTASGNAPYRWTQSGGMVALAPNGGSSDVSADGSVVVGRTRGDPWCSGAGTWRAMIWTEAGGTQFLQDVLEAAGLGAELEGWDLLKCYAVSTDGRTFLGEGTLNCGSKYTGWIAHLGDFCYADCDKTTGNGVLDIFDFLCFQNSFVNGETYACDCDTTTGLGVCDIFDFLCFQNAFVAGCP